MEGLAAKVLDAFELDDTPVVLAVKLNIWQPVTREGYWAWRAIGEEGEVVATSVRLWPSPVLVLRYLMELFPAAAITVAAPRSCGPKGDL